MKDILIPAGLAEGDRTKNILIRRDRKFPDRIFLRTPHPGRLSLTPEQAIELTNTIADILEEETHEPHPPATPTTPAPGDHQPNSHSLSRGGHIMQHPPYNPHHLETTVTELATLIGVTVDHARNHTPIPDATFTHPQIAANVAAHLATFFAMHTFHDWGALNQWLTDLETKGLEHMTNNPQPLNK